MSENVVPKEKIFYKKTKLQLTLVFKLLTPYLAVLREIRGRGRKGKIKVANRKDKVKGEKPQQSSSSSRGDNDGDAKEVGKSVVHTHKRRFTQTNSTLLE